MIMKKFFKVIKSLISNRRGFALLELIITLTLLGILLAMGFMFYSFGVVSYNIGEEQTDIQQNARLAADYIISELRVAEAVTIVKDYEHLDIDDFGMEHADETPVFYIYVKDNDIYYQEHGDLADEEKPGDGINLTAILENISTNIDFELSFAKSTTEDKANILEFDLSAKNINSDREYVLDTQLLVLNLDEIEEHNLEGDSGTALAYQVPAPEHPIIRRVTIRGSDYHYWENTEADLDIEVFVETLNVDDGKSVKVEFLRVGEYGAREEISGFPGDFEQTHQIEDDQARFYSADNRSLKVPNNLGPFGNYYVLVTVDQSDEGLHLTQGRFYYIHPKIWDIVVDETRGSPFLCEGSLKTGGVPEGTGAILGTEDDIDDAVDDILILVYDQDAQEYIDPGELRFHSIDEVDEDGNLSYTIRFDDSDDYREDVPIIMEHYIGGIRAVAGFRTPDYYLSGLEVWNTGGDEKDMNPEFAPDTFVYDVTTQVISITIKAEHGYLDENNESVIYLARIIKDGETVLEKYVANESFEKDIEITEAETVVEVELVNEIEEVLTAYTINVTLEND